MNKADFLFVLERELYNISPEERQDAILYYKEYFEDAGFENEATVLNELGNPVLVAREIKANCATNQGFYSQGTQQGYNNTTNNSYNNQNNSYNNQGAYPQGGYPPPKKAKGCGGCAVFSIIAVVTFPIWFTVLSILLGITFGAGGAVAGVLGGVVGLVGGIIGAIVLGITTIFTIGAPIGVLGLGIGLLLLAIVIIVLSIGAWVIYKLIIYVVSLLK